MPESLQEWVRSLETQPGFHRDKVAGFKEAVERLPLDETFLVEPFQSIFSELQGFHIVQLSEVISLLVEQAHGTEPLHSEVDEVLQVCLRCHRGQIAMDISLCLDIVLDTLKSAVQAEKTVAFITGKVEALDILYRELAETGAVDLREVKQQDNFDYKPDCFHPSKTFRECYKTLKCRSHFNSGHALIKATVSLVRVERARKKLNSPHNCDKGAILRAWIELLKTSYISTNLAILIANMEEDRCNRTVEELTGQPSKVDGHSAEKPLLIVLPDFVAGTRKLKSQSEDQSCGGEAIFHMMSAPGGFDTGPDCFEAATSQAQVEKRWRLLLDAVPTWKEYPLEIMKLFLDVSVTNDDLERVLCVQSNGTVIVPCVAKFLEKIKESKGREEVATATAADGAEEQRGEQEGTEGNAQAGTRNVFTRIFFILLSLFGTRTDLIDKASKDLLECSEKVSAQEMEAMFRELPAITDRSDIAPENLWIVLVTISCNSRITQKAEVWKKYLFVHESLEWKHELSIFLGILLNLLNEENALVLLGGTPPTADLVSVLCAQVATFVTMVNGDVNCHFPLISSLVRRAAVKKEAIETLLNACLQLPKHPTRQLKEGVYETLLAAIAGAVDVGTYDPSVDDHVIRCVTCALLDLSEPFEVVSLFMDLKGLPVWTWKFGSASHGQHTMTIAQMLVSTSVQVPLSKAWMDNLVVGTGKILSCDGPILGKISLLRHICRAVIRDGLEQLEELRNALECLFFCVQLGNRQKLRFMEQLLNIPNIMHVFGREVTQRVVRPGAVVTPLKLSFTPSFVGRFDVEVGTEGALQTYRLLASLATDTHHINLLPWIFKCALENLNIDMKNFVQDLRSIVGVLKKSPADSLPFVGECMVASYRCKLTRAERNLLRREVNDVVRGSVRIRNVFNLHVGEILVRGWQLPGNTLHSLSQKLLSVLSHLDGRGIFYNVSVRHSDFYRSELQWLFLETQLAPPDIAFCIRVRASSFGENDPLHHERFRIGDTSETNTPTYLRPLGVAMKFLTTLRSNFGEAAVKEYLIKILLKTVFSKSCCHMVQKGSSADGKSCEILPSATEIVQGALALINSCSCVDQLVMWLESPHLLTCGHTMTVVLVACQWKKEETDVDFEQKVEVNRKCKSLLENSVVKICSQTSFVKLDAVIFILKLNLCHGLSVKLLDLCRRSARMASECGRVISQWQSSEQGMELLERLLSRWPGKESNTADDDTFECTYLSKFPSYPESAEGFYRLWSRLNALRKLSEHGPLVKGLNWHGAVVSKSRIDATVASAWLRIFYAGRLQLQEVYAVTSLTSEEAGQLLPGSNCIDDCLFTPATVNAILDNGKLDKNALQFYLIVARMLSEIFGAVRRMDKEDRPRKTQVLEILREAAKKVCEVAQNVVACNGGNTSTRTVFVRKADRKDLYARRRQYLEKVFGKMFCSSDDGEFRGDWSSGKSDVDSILVLLRRWLAAHPKMPAMQIHVSHIFGLVAHGIKLPQATEVSSQTSGHELRDKRSSPTHCDPGERGRQVSESAGPWAQRVQEYVLNLKENQACIARLQSAGYNRGVADLWHGDPPKLTAQIRRQDVSNTVERNRVLKHICQPYLTLLIELKVGVVEVGGEAKPVSELFARDLTLEELNREVSAVRRNLAEMEDESLQGKIRPVLTLEEERREYIRILRDCDAQVDHVMKACSRSPTRTEH